MSFSLGNRRSGTKRKITELSEDGVLVAKPRKGLRKHFHSVVPTCSCILKKTGNAKLHQKDFEKKRLWKQNRKQSYLSFHCALFKAGAPDFRKDSGAGPPM